MAMTKKEREAIDVQIEDLATRAALRWSDMPRPAPLAIGDVWRKEDAVEGWVANTYSRSATKGSRVSRLYASGWASDGSLSSSWSQNTPPIYATEAEALVELRYRAQADAAKALLAIDRAIEAARKKEGGA